MLTEEINKAVKYLIDGGIIIYPTDTVWGIGCDALNAQATKKILDIKQKQTKGLIVLMKNINMLKTYFDPLSNAILKRLYETQKQPTTYILPDTTLKNPYLINKDHSLAIRIPKNEFCAQLLSAFRYPIVSTSANPHGAPTPKSFRDINNALLSQADHIIDYGRDKVSDKASQIIRLDRSGNQTILRP